PVAIGGKLAWLSASQSVGGSFSQERSGTAPPKRSQARASRAARCGRSGGAVARPSTHQDPPGLSSKTLTAASPSSASVAAAAVAASGARSITRHSPLAALRARLSGFFDKAVHHHLVAGLVEGDRELAVLGRSHRAIAEFLVEDPVTRGEGAGGGRARRLEPRRFGMPAEEAGAVRPSLGEAGRARMKAGLGNGLDMLGGQLGDEARGQRALPLAVDAAIGCVGDEGTEPRARQPDIGEPPLLLQPFDAGL